MTLRFLDRIFVPIKCLEIHTRAGYGSYRVDNLLARLSLKVVP